jgi:peptide/nickel transport system substrate-binding protein
VFAFRRRVLAALGLACLSALAGCARAKPLAPADYLQVDIPTSPATLDPRVATDAISDRIDELIYDPLVKAGPDGAFRGDLAASVERPDPLRLIFHLRRGVPFSDGRELTARDVVFTYDSIMNPATHSLKSAGLAGMKSIRALDPYTVEITTRRPYAPALEMATYDVVPAGSPPPERLAGSVPPGTGPFRLTRFARDEGIVLARNVFRPYPGDSARGIFVKVVPDATVRALELAEGICDFAENDGIQPDLIPYLSARRDLAVSESPGTTFAYLAFNFRDPRLRDLRLRRALAYAIDRPAIISAMLRGTARAATGMLTPENWAYEGGVTRYAYDPAAARRLLEQAGYAPGDPRLRFTYATTPEGRRLAEALQAMLKRVGVTLDIHTSEWATYYDDLRRGAFDLTSSQWVGISDPHQYRMIFDSKMTPPNGDNRGAYSNLAMDRLVEAGDAALDPAHRRALYAQVQKLAAADLPCVPLWWMDTVVAINRRVSGFHPYPNGSLASLATAGYVAGAARRRFGD